MLAADSMVSSGEFHYHKEKNRDSPGDAQMATIQDEEQSRNRFKQQYQTEITIQRQRQVHSLKPIMKAYKVRGSQQRRPRESSMPTNMLEE